jgi:predicted PurR-regulated permease PerM
LFGVYRVFQQEFDFKTKYGLDLSDEQVMQLKKIFAIANLDHSGIIGRRQFSDLMFLLGIEPTHEELDAMLLEMDENGDGQIEFEEFVVAMVNMYDPQLLADAADTPLGGMGTRAWARGEILWCANNNFIVIATGVAIAGLVKFDFILVPLTLAYFMTFLLIPLMNVFEQRPLIAKKKSCCTPKDHPKREEAPDSMFISCYDLFTVCKMPHGVALLGTLGLFFGVLIFLFALVGGEMAAFLEDPVIKANMEQLGRDYDQFLNDSDIIIIEPPICEWTCEWTPEWEPHDGTASDPGACDCPTHSTLPDKNLCKGAKGVPCAHDGYTPDDIDGFVGLFSGFFNMFALVMLFVIYLMLEKDPNEKMFKGDSKAAGEIEHMIDHYISLKTILSFLTGLIVAVMLLICSIQLAVLFGIMSFVLNYIPNVGSVIAMFLPLPVVLLDPQLEAWQKIGAFAGPGLVQGYVGNVLEPTVFGASLNMTPLSILSALVMWSSVWGLPGAILSVPMLGIQKITCNYINHPFAQYVLMLIREDPTLDEEKAREESGDFGLPIPIPGDDADGDDAPAKADAAPAKEEEDTADE